MAAPGDWEWETYAVDGCAENGYQPRLTAPSFTVTGEIVNVTSVVNAKNSSITSVTDAVSSHFHGIPCYTTQFATAIRASFFVQ